MTQALARRSRKIVPAGVRIAFRNLRKELKIARTLLASAPKFKITVLLRHISFNAVVVSSFREDVDPTSELRRSGSFYVEAIK